VVNQNSLIFDYQLTIKSTTMPHDFDDFDMFIGPEELQDDNPIDSDFEPFDLFELDRSEEYEEEF